MAVNSIQSIEKKLKIGILIRDLEKLQNWEYRILKGIIEHPNLDLCLFIKDGREQKKIEKRNILFNILYKFQMKIELRKYKNEQTIDTNEIIERVKNTKTIYLTPSMEGASDVFSEVDAEKIKDYGLDIILQHEFDIIQGNILKTSRYGIWKYYYDVDLKLFNNESCCEVTLRQLTPGSNDMLVIDKAWFNKKGMSYFQTYLELPEKSVVMLFKSINKLLCDGHIEIKKTLISCNKLYKKQHLKQLFLYMVNYYLKALGDKFNRLLFPQKRSCCWALVFGKGNFIETSLFKTNPVKMPKKEFWADPFLYEYDKQLYVFFENYSYKTNKGKISVGKVIENANDKYSVVDVQDVLDLNYHLSYPQIVKENNEIFMIPEASQNQRLEIYRCIQFPRQWELYATAFDGEKIIDTTYFCDENGEKWLFLNKGIEPEAELHIYKIDTLKLKNIIAHKLNPVIIDCRKGRNGGTIFKYKNEYYRPSQINTHGIYGKGLQISKIKKLTLDEFEDEPVIGIEHNFNKKLIGLHHLHQLEKIFAFDVCYKRL